MYSGPHTTLLETAMTLLETTHDIVRDRRRQRNQEKSIMYSKLYWDKLNNEKVEY